MDRDNCVCTENKSQVSQEHTYLTENLSHLCYQERMSLNEYMMHLDNNLNDSYSQRVYNKITISQPLMPNLIIATSSALIDTGALHGSYAGTWILAHNLCHGTHEHNVQVCSPINNTCSPLTQSVIAGVSVCNLSKTKKIFCVMHIKI